MTELIKIGNSQGVRIPKPLIEQAQLSDKQLVFKIVDDGLLISPVKQARAGWESSVKEAVANYQLNKQEDQQWLDLPLSTDDDLQW